MRQRHMLVLTGPPESVSRVSGLLRELVAFFSGNDLTMFLSAPLNDPIQGELWELFTSALDPSSPTIVTPLFGGGEREL